MDYRKIDNLEEFNALVSKFVTERETLKQRIRQERFGEVATERVGEPALTKREVEQKPTIDAIERLRTDIKKQKATSFNLYEQYANNRKLGSTEVKAKRVGTIRYDAL